MIAVQLFALFLAAGVLSAVCVTPIRRLAVAWRLLDMPDDDRRSHRRPIPRLGGVAVFAGFVIATIAGVAYQTLYAAAEPRSIAHTAQMLAACSILFAIGLIDDLRGVRPVVKLAGQTVAALIVQYHWNLLSAVVIAPDVRISLGWVGVPIITLWLVGVSNALNLVDGLDGLAGGVSIIALAAMAGATYFLHGPAPIACVALAGALLGFLRYNFPRARIFLGDSGSLVVGFLLAFLSVRRATRHDGAMIAIVPLFALAYPLIDTAIAMMRRWLRGHPLSRADGRHVHHQLIALGLTPERAAMAIWTFSFCVAGLGLSLAFEPPAFTLTVSALTTVALVGLLVYAVHRLQYHEFIDAGAIIGSAGRLAKHAIRDAIHTRDVANLVSRAANLCEIDGILGSHAETFGFVHMQVGGHNAHLPKEQRRSARSVWKLEYPIIVPTTSGFKNSGRLEESLVLTIWCAKGSAGVRSASAERVAQSISAAVAAWTQTAHPTVEREIRVRARTPDSGHSSVVRMDKEYRESGEHERVMADT